MKPNGVPKGNSPIMPPTMPNGTPAKTTSGLVTLLNWKTRAR